MRTATITFHAPNNNGSFLQAYALQTTLRKLDIENDIIDFYSPAQMRQYSVLRVPHSMGDLGRNIISMIHYSSLSQRFATFENLRNRYLQLTNQCSKEEDVYELAKEYDVIICGSDQIWNTSARDYSDVYFMPDINVKKIAYSVSFGAHVEKIDQLKAINNMNDFDAISVREQNGYQFLKRAGFDNVEIVCDPALLLDRKDYEKFISNNMSTKKPYILLYTIGYGTDILKSVQQLSKKLHIPVYAPFTGYSAIKCKRYGIKVLYNAGPGEFLKLIENASCVCSDSFHGIVFSIIFHKQFYRLGSLNEKGQPINDDRIDSLLAILDLNDRMLYRTSNGKLEYSESKIDYIPVDDKVRKMQQTGVNYLKKSLLT